VTFDIDADPVNADWVKQSWDLPRDPAAFTPAELEELSRSQVWEFAPQAIQDALANQRAG